MGDWVIDMKVGFLRKGRQACLAITRSGCGIARHDPVCGSNGIERVFLCLLLHCVCTAQATALGALRDYTSGFLDDDNLREMMRMAGVEARSDLLERAFSVEKAAEVVYESFAGCTEEMGFDFCADCGCFH